MELTMHVLNTLLVVVLVAGAESVIDVKESMLEAKLEEVIDRVKALEENVAEKSALINQQNEKIKKLQNDTENARSNLLMYAFTTFLDHTVTNPAPDQPIKFNRVLMNTGMVYNSTTGKFKCPADGLYFFTYSIENDAAGHFVTKLIVEGKNQVNAVNGQYQNAGNSAVVGLKNGQSVWVAVNGGNTTIWNSDVYRYSTFTGISLF